MGAEVFSRPIGYPKGMSRFPVLPLLVGLALLLAGLLGLYFLWPGLREGLEGVYRLLSRGNLKEIRAWVASLGWVGPLAILLLMIAQTLVSVVPMTLVMLVSVLAFGPVLGGVLGWTGAVVAAMVGYGLARLLGPVVVDRLVSEPIRRKVEAHVERYGPWAIVALRFSLVVPTDSVNFVAGLVRMHPLKFLLATALGAAPVAVVVAWLGSDFTRLGPFLLVAGLLGLLGLAAWVIYDRRRARQGSSQQGLHALHRTHAQGAVGQPAEGGGLGVDLDEVGLAQVGDAPQAGRRLHLGAGADDEGHLGLGKGPLRPLEGPRR